MSSKAHFRLSRRSAQSLQRLTCRAGASGLGAERPAALGFAAAWRFAALCALGTAFAFGADSPAGNGPAAPPPSPAASGPAAATLRSAEVNSSEAQPDAQDPNSDNLIVSPAHGWVLPIFTPEGYYNLVLRGDQVQIRRNGQIFVQDVKIDLYSGNAANVFTTIILSPEATYFPHENVASGPSIVRVLRTADNSELSGADWTYHFGKGPHGSREKLIIRRDARVVLEQQIHDFLQ